MRRNNAQNTAQTPGSMILEWFDGFKIRTTINRDVVVISGNKEGLLSLAAQLTALADGMPGEHIHYDEHNSLEEGSVEMIVEKVP